MKKREALLGDEKIFSCVQLLKKKGAKEIYLFGSRANDCAREDSDFDFGIRGMNPDDFFCAWHELELLTKANVDLADFDEHPEFLAHLNNYNGAVRL